MPSGNPKTKGLNPRLSLVFVGLLSLLGCDRNTDGNIVVTLEAQPAIPDGIPAGDEPGDIDDGFDVFFARYIIAVGNVALSRDGGEVFFSNRVVVADFTKLTDELLELEFFSGLPIGRYSPFSFETTAPTPLAVRWPRVGLTRFEEMIANRWTYDIRGTISETDGLFIQTFVIQADVQSIYTNCRPPEKPLGVPVGTASDTVVTMHGDHLFFTNFEQQQDQLRLGEWMMMVVDVDEDGILTQPDFEAATDLDALFPPDEYDLSGGPLPINNAWDFIRAQLGTQGYIFGDGDCDWSNLEP